MRTLVLALVLFASVSGCVESAVVVCEDTVCPADTTCSVHGCLTASQLEACSTLPDGSPCTTSSGAGICDDQACILTICGNGSIEAPEVCDDGNQVAGDGCNGTCTSNESCGNGIAELAEACDCGDSVHDGPASCLGTKNGGMLCSDTCTSRRCGNSVLDPGEVCDDGNQSSADGCNSTCNSNETCGNGIAELDEVCDCGDPTHPGPPSCNGTINGGTECTSTCTSRRCGDGNMDPGEACDDGNQVAADGCNSTCTSDETCGNGIAELLEECDCGDASSPGGTACTGTFNGGTICTTLCTARRCGDGTVDANEACDDGNQTSADGCNSTCTSDETCGNGIAELTEQCDCGDLLNPGAASCNSTINGGAICSSTCMTRQCGNNVLDPGEVCDDGDQMGGDGCNSTCTSTEICGNGISELAEECDCGNASNPGPASCLGTFNGGALCSATCMTRRCGNGVLDPGEVCDDGNQGGGDGCNSTCTSKEICGNGIPELAEECDCGNASNPGPASCNNTINGGALCSTTCMTRRCGNGVLDPGEVCDDGNQGGGDGCNSTCSSNETCGNGIPELAEECDCGNASNPGPASCNNTFNGGTVCSSTCMTRRCGNGVTDPGEICDDGGTVSGDGCNSTCSSIEECGNGIAELSEECDCGDASTPGAASCNGTFNGGTICSTLCMTRRCGNEVVDPGEVCDDGNFAEGDGCSAACTSDETCPNGIVDFGVGEQCDEGDTRNKDGCSSVCRVEPLLWQKLRSDQAPSARRTALAYDAARGRVVLFGGHSGSTVNDTWEFDGTTWIQRTPTSVPPSRRDHAMAYDAKRGRVVLFGGKNASTYAIDDTWEYDGTNWIQRTIAGAKPAARTGHAMVYDSTRDRVVLFGGITYPNGVPTWSQETWAYDGTSWTLLSPTNRPSVRDQHGMAYDPDRDVVVLFGGRNNDGEGAASNGTLGETWEFNGTNWNGPISTTTVPSARAGHALTYDPVRNRVLMYGGERWNPFVMGHTEITNAYEYDGSNWIVAPSLTGDGRMHYGLVFDQRRGRSVLFGGGNYTHPLSDPTEILYGETWEFNGAWTLRTLPTPVGPHAGSSMAFDAARGRLVSYGGTNGGVNVSETWELVGDTWIAGPSGPPGRFSASAAYDSARRVMVVFGGSTGTTAGTDETWEYNGTTWTQKFPSMKPSPRFAHATVFDPVRNRVVLFGGRSGANDYDDTWEYDGTTWSPLTLATKPLPRHFHSMAYDRARQRVVLFGGRSPGDVYSTDVWEFNGTWQKRVVSNPPPGRMEHAIAYDTVRDVLIAYGGKVVADFDDIWELESAAAAWVQYVAPPASSVPGFRSSHMMAYDTAQQRLIAFGGVSGQSVNGDTWSYGHVAIESSEACSSKIDYDGDGAIGCVDPDCWGVCTPLCDPDQLPAQCPSTPRCGDGACGFVEDCRSCPADCPVGSGSCPLRCGDFFCDTGETAASCPGDCTP